MLVSAYYAAAAHYLVAAQAAVARYAAVLGTWQVSNIIDSEGHQYVDLVMEGGGVLGIALAGYVYVLEQLGVRFLQLGGTSARSINTLLMAAAGPVQMAKTDWLLERFSAQNLPDFVDGDDDARNFVQVLDNIKQHFGLNPGAVFYEWPRQLLNEQRVRTVRDLNRLRTLTAADGPQRRDGQCMPLSTRFGWRWRRPFSKLMRHPILKFTTLLFCKCVKIRLDKKFVLDRFKQLI